MSPPRKPRKAKQQEPEGITKITVKGFKSLANETSIEIRPLTILAGANSSGKSSIMQPLLLMKQTLEAPYDPGGLRLDGPHVEFTHNEQILSRCSSGAPATQLVIGLEVGEQGGIETTYASRTDRPLNVIRTVERSKGEVLELVPDLPHDELVARVPSSLAPWVPASGTRRLLKVWRRGCFLRLSAGSQPSGSLFLGVTVPPLVPAAEPQVLRAVHVGGNRGVGGRMYPKTATGPMFPGPFQPYTGSMVLHWQQTNDPRRRKVAADLAAMELADDVTARAFGDVGIEVFVPIRPVGANQRWKDTANIVDVGTSVQHVLPVVVALHAAEPGRLVYIEQPEIHLHPRAQVALAGLLADAAKRGVRVVAETHSSLLLRAIQTLVADREEELGPEDVALHWFTRRESDGVTEVKTADLGEGGTFGDWPEDFSVVELEAEGAFLDAARDRVWGK